MNIVSEKDDELKVAETAIKYYKSESIRLASLIKNAKTSTKKQYYKIKLKENNNIFSKYLYLYDKVKSNKRG